MEKKTWSAYKTYLAIASLTGLIGGVISLGIALTTIGQRLIITNQEYVDGDRYYVFEQCKYKYADDGSNQKPSQEEIEKCEEKQKEQLIIGRSVRTKETTLGGLIRAVLFSALFFSHYPRFKKSDNK